MVRRKVRAAAVWLLIDSQSRPMSSVVNWATLQDNGTPLSYDYSLMNIAIRSLVKGHGHHHKLSCSMKP